MVKGHARRLAELLLLAGLMSGLLGGCSTDNDSPAIPELRGVWMQARSTATPEEVDELLARIEAGRFNAVLVGVLYRGHAYYESSLVRKDPSLEPGYDPLAYVIEQAHKRGIAVHAWLAVGRMDYRGGPAPTLTEHPDWAMIGPDGRQTFWLNWTRPEVRQFVGDLVLEIVKNYDVDGIHFDYLRYPGPEWGFDAYSLELFGEEYGVDANLLRYSELPAYATFEGNPLADVGTAQVLATFDDGQPAVLLNSYGAGEAILLNWNASQRQVAVGSGILDRSINYLSDGDGEIYVLNSETNGAKYGSEGFDNGMAWLEDLGRQPMEATEGELASLDANGVLVLPNVYLTSAQAASDLADFVRRGGGVILIDGPTPSIEDKHLQAITGMRGRGKYFNGTRLLIAAREHDIIPNSKRALTLGEYKALDAQWKRFRKESINKLLQEVYQRIKQENPEVLVSITVSGDQENLAEEHLLDWRTWLGGGCVDLIIPRAYVDQDEPLVPLVGAWQPEMESSGRIVLGLKAYSDQDQEDIPKTPERVLGEIELARTSGSKGIVLFDIGRTGDDVLTALAAGPFSPLDTASH